eukprot:40493-Chlamydomonas_euryale.AAC.2
MLSTAPASSLSSAYSAGVWSTVAMRTGGRLHAHSHKCEWWTGFNEQETGHTVRLAFREAGMGKRGVTGATPTNKTPHTKTRLAQRPPALLLHLPLTRTAPTPTTHPHCSYTYHPPALLLHLPPTRTAPTPTIHPHCSYTYHSPAHTELQRARQRHRSRSQRHAPVARSARAATREPGDCLRPGQLATDRVQRWLQPDGATKGWGMRESHVQRVTVKVGAGRGEWLGVVDLEARHGGVHTKSWRKNSHLNFWRKQDCPQA